MRIVQHDPDLALLGELKNGLHQHAQWSEASERNCESPAAGQGGLSPRPHRNRVQAKELLLEILENGLVRLSHAYLGVKLRIAQELAREGRGEDMDLMGLMEQIEGALADTRDKD